MTPAALFDAARAAARHAYAPYSKFAVGAAVLLSDGAVMTGANVENASFGLSLCAETVALAKVANAGRLGDVVEIAVVGGTGPDPVFPCGRCRQVINEAAHLGRRDIVVHCASGDGVTVARHMLTTLLPNAFGPAAIGVTS